MHSRLAVYISELIGEQFSRGSAKNVKYGCSYNSQPKRVAKTIGKPLAVGQVVFDAFWEKAKPLALFKTAAQKYWETTGQKRFIKGIDGRKIPIRSKGNCVNSAFQSAGVICAKRAMVIHEQKLRANGLIVDFFKDDWRNSVYSQQLIAYHDESNGEVSRSEVTMKTFKIRPYTDEVHALPNGKTKTDEELAHEEAKALALAYKDSQCNWSEVGHTATHYYTGYCLTGALAVESVRESGEYYKLNVPLSAGYNLGRTWAGVH